MENPSHIAKQCNMSICSKGKVKTMTMLPSSHEESTNIAGSLVLGNIITGNNGHRRYKILEKLTAIGSFGTVFKARGLTHPNEDRFYAVKIPLFDGGYNRDRFENEAKRWKEIKETHFVMPLAEEDTSFRLENGHEIPGFITEFSERGDISRYMNGLRTSGERLPLVYAVQWTIDLLTALTELEAVKRVAGSSKDRDFIHGDVKLENALLYPTTPFAYGDRLQERYGNEDRKVELEVRLTDFTTLREIAEIETTITNHVRTRSYSDPDTIKDNKRSEWLDLWSVNVCLYFMLTDRHPFRNGLTIEKDHIVESRILNIEYPPLNHHEIPYRISAVVERAFHKNPAERFQSPADFRQALLAAWERRDELEQAGGPNSQNSEREDPLVDWVLKVRRDRNLKNTIVVLGAITFLFLAYRLVLWLTLSRP